MLCIVFLLVGLSSPFILTATHMLGRTGDVGKSELSSIIKKKIEPATNVTVTLKDVKGNEEAKMELGQLVDYLKHPDKYSNVRVPKGVLLSGPPGTGKTLLARALAGKNQKHCPPKIQLNIATGEAGVPFLAISGSEIEEIFVGVGAKRIRSLFKKARSYVYIDISSPCQPERIHCVLGSLYHIH